MLELQCPAGELFPGDAKWQRGGVCLGVDDDDGVRAGRGVAVDGVKGTVLMVGWLSMLNGDGTGVTGVSGAAELALLLALLEVREVGLRVPAFFLKTLTGFSRYDMDILVTLLESDSSSEL